MFGLEIVDFVVIVLYFAALVVIGFRAMKHIHSQEDYFMGGRRFGKLVQFFSSFGMATSSETAVGTTTTTFTNGASGVWSNLLTLWATPAFWLMTHWYRRLRVLTLGDFFEERYGSRRMAMLYALLMSVFMMGGMALGLKAVSVTVAAIAQKNQAEFTPAEQAEFNEALELDQLQQAKGKEHFTAEQQQRLELLEIQKPRKMFSHVNENALNWTICAIVFIYAVAGGLEAAVYTDVLQGIGIILLSVLLIPFGLARINTLFGGTGVLGAFQEMHHQLPEWYFEIFGSPWSMDFTWYYIAALSVLAIISNGVQAIQVNTYGSAKDEFTARWGATSGTFMKRICTVLWGFLGIIAVTLYTDQLSHSDYVWGHTTRDLFGSLHIGLVGLVIACLMAALMSSASMAMITTSGLLTRNIYRQIFPRGTEAHYVTVGRTIGGGVLVGAVLTAAGFETILQLLKFLWEFNVILAASFWCGMKWRRANRYGAWSSMIFALGAFALLPTFLPRVWPSLTKNPALLKRTDPSPVTRTYRAREMDIRKRNQEIQAWEEQNRHAPSNIPRPETLVVGQEMTKVFQPPRQAVFWSKGVSLENGTLRGAGFFYAELFLLDQFWDLSRNPYALNETIRTLIRTFFPFVILILVSLLTRPDNSDRLVRFFMKMRTPVLPDRHEDLRQLELSYTDPNRFREKLLFPNSSLELMKWSKIDFLGLLVCIFVVFAVLTLLYILLHIGS